MFSKEGNHRRAWTGRLIMLAVCVGALLAVALFWARVPLRRPVDGGSAVLSRRMILRHVKVAEEFRSSTGGYPRDGETMWSIYPVQALAGLDSWGHPLSYERNSTERVETITICSFGRDYFWGGKGDNADICVCVPEAGCAGFAGEDEFAGLGYYLRVRAW